MTTASVQLLQPSFTASGGGGGDGDIIDSLRSECGYVVQAIDWVCRRLGFDLIAHIIEPISGDFGAVEKIAANWSSLGTGLTEVGANYATIAKATSTVWEGDAADRAAEKIANFGHGAEVMGEAGKLISDSLGDVLRAAKGVAEVVAKALSMVDDLVLTLAGSVIKLAKEIFSGGETVRKIVSLVKGAIDAIETLSKVVPPILKIFHWMSTIFHVLDDLFKVGATGTAWAAGNQMDDVAKHGFQG